MTTAPPLPWGLHLPDGTEGLDQDQQVRGTGGRVLCAVGLGVTLYIAQGDRPEVREGMLKAYERWVQVSGRDFLWGGDPDTGELLAVARSGVGSVRAWPPAVLQRFDFQMSFHGGARQDDASAHSLLAVSREREESQLSYLHVTLPLAWAAKRPATEFRDLVLELCTLVGPTHGYAGLFVVHGGLDDEASQAFHALGRRFRGLELDYPPQHEPYLATRERIKGVGWLTVVGESWLATVGGRQALVDGLGAAAVHDFASLGTGAQGVVLQAGPHPKLGDVSIDEPMLDYERVARLLKPIRIIDPAVIWPQGLPGFDFHESKAWMTRFDRA